MTMQYVYVWKDYNNYTLGFGDFPPNAKKFGICQENATNLPDFCQKCASEVPSISVELFSWLWFHTYEDEVQNFLKEMYLKSDTSDWGI